MFRGLKCKQNDDIGQKAIFSVAHKFCQDLYQNRVGLSRTGMASTNEDTLEAGSGRETGIREQV
jgi:hypothetical protein